MFLRLVYIVFTGILLALFVGVGINTFYKGPVAPEYPSIKYGAYPDRTRGDRVSEQERKEMRLQEAYEKESRQYNKRAELYHRNVSIIALTAAILMMILSLTLLKSLLVIADGVLLGSVFTLLYSIGRGFESNDSQFRFIVVTIGVCVALFLGYVKFVKPTSSPAKKKK